MKSLEEQDPLQWPAVNTALMDYIQSDENGDKLYEGTTLRGYSDAVDLQESGQTLRLYKKYW